MRSWTLAATLAVAVAVLVPPTAASAQLGAIKKKLEARKDSLKKATGGRIETSAGTVIDSVADKTGRKADTVVTRTGNTLTGAVEAADRAVVNAVTGKKESGIAKQFATGRVVLTDLQFAADGSLESASLPAIRELAALMKRAADAWAIEVHTAPAADAQPRSDARAKALKAALVAEGADAGRVWARGSGATQAPTAPTPADRVELTRMQ